MNKRAKIFSTYLVIPATEQELDLQPLKATVWVGGGVEGGLCAKIRGALALDRNKSERVMMCTWLSLNSSTCTSLP